MLGGQEIGYYHYYNILMVGCSSQHTQTNLMMDSNTYSMNVLYQKHYKDHGLMPTLGIQDHCNKPQPISKLNQDNVVESSPLYIEYRNSSVFTQVGIHSIHHTMGKQRTLISCWELMLIGILYSRKQNHMLQEQLNLNQHNPYYGMRGRRYSTMPPTKIPSYRNGRMEIRAIIISTESLNTHLGSG